MGISFPTLLWELYGLDPAAYTVSKASSGHINQTFILKHHQPGKPGWVLQKINHRIFTHPVAIARNCNKAAEYLQKADHDYLFIAPIANKNGELLSIIEGEYWRALPYIPNSVALDVLDQPEQAYEAARQFGRLARLLDGIDTSAFEATIPQFHDLNWRSQQYEEALDKADQKLKMAANKAIELAAQYRNIAAEFDSIKKELPLRIQHHDTKISNVLLDKKTHRGICVIDLDTLMPGYFISDLGDMMRTYLCAFDENERDLSKIRIREEFFEATLKGYLSEMGAVLNDTEKQHLLLSGKYLIYIQSIRFLTDYLQGSTYYPTSYPEQSLDRALNQFQLLGDLIKKEDHLKRLINVILSLSKDAL